MSQPTLNDSLIITTSGRQYDIPHEPNAEVVYFSPDNFLGNALSQIKSYVAAHGTIKNLTIVSHGNSLIMGADDDNKNTLSTSLAIPDLIDGIKELQTKLGVKVADRIVLNACLTMTNLQPSDVNYLRSSAKSLGSEIAGATTPIAYDNTNSGREIGLMAVFMPDGSVHRDKLSATGIFDRLTLARTVNQGEYLHQTRSIIRAITSRDSDLEKAHHAEWFACHEGKSQAEGASCQIGDHSALPKERTDSRNFGAIKTGIWGDDTPAKQDGQKEETRASTTVVGSKAPSNSL